MKKLSRIFAFILAGIALVTVLSCAHQIYFHHDVSLQFGKEGAEYVEVDQPALDAALRALKSHGGKCYITFMDNNGKVTDPYPPCGDIFLKTDKKRTSANTKTRPAGQSAANDPNITYRVQGPSKDVLDVLNAFK
jgi:hypothetical protein